MEFSRSEYGVGSVSLLQGNLSNPGIEPGSSALQADSLPAEPQVKTKNTGVGSLSLLQRIFPTKEWNQGLLHCRWILSVGKECACNAGNLVPSLGWEDPLEKGMATHFSLLAWRIPMDRGAWRATVCRVTKSQT